MIRLFAVLSFVTLALGGCTYVHDWVQRYRVHHAIVNRDYKTALGILQRETERDFDQKQELKAARRGARVAHILAQNYPLAIEFYKKIILLSPSVDERLAAEKSIAQIEFENLQDYNRSTVDYEELLHLDPVETNKFNYQLHVVKSQYRLNRLNQALIEANALLEKKLSPDQTFQTKVLKANILVASKKLQDAADLWEEVLQQFPEQSKQSKVALNLLVCYEELKQFDNAIALLQKIRIGNPHPEFIDAQIKRLKELQINQPGANGLRR